MRVHVDESRTSFDRSGGRCDAPARLRLLQPGCRSSRCARPPARGCRATTYEIRRWSVACRRTRSRPAGRRRPRRGAGGRAGRRRSERRDVRERIEGAPGSMQLMPGIALSAGTRKSRLRRNSATISSTASCGPSRAATPASWTNGGTHEVELTISRVRGSTSSEGTAAYPRRHPVMANVFEKPSRRIVRSSMPGSDAIDGASTSYVIREYTSSVSTQPVSADRGCGPTRSVERNHAARRVLRGVQDHEPRALGQRAVRARPDRS